MSETNNKPYHPPQEAKPKIYWTRWHLAKMFLDYHLEMHPDQFLSQWQDQTLETWVEERLTVFRQTLAKVYQSDGLFGPSVEDDIFHAMCPTTEEPPPKPPALRSLAMQAKAEEEIERIQDKYLAK